MYNPGDIWIIMIFGIGILLFFGCMLGGNNRKDS